VGTAWAAGLAIAAFHTSLLGRFGAAAVAATTEVAAPRSSGVVEAMPVALKKMPEIAPCLLMEWPASVGVEDAALHKLPECSRWVGVPETGTSQLPESPVKMHNSLHCRSEVLGAAVAATAVVQGSPEFHLATAVVAVVAPASRMCQPPRVEASVGAAAAKELARR